MNLAVFAVLDKAVGAYTKPFFVRTKGEAIRSFSEACNASDGPFKYPDDYVLYELGSWDDNSGVFRTNEPVRVIGARECLHESSTSAVSQLPVAS